MQRTLMSATVVHSVAGSTAALLHLGEAATLASTAAMRSVLDLTRLTPRTSGASVHPVAADPVAADPVSADPVAPAEVSVDRAPVDQVAPAAAAVPLGDPVVPHWDELNLARIRGRLPRLTVTDVRSLLAYERAHAGRQPVVAMLENRIRKIETLPTERSLVVGPGEHAPAPPAAPGAHDQEEQRPSDD